MAEGELQIMMALDHPTSNDLLSLLLVLDGQCSLLLCRLLVILSSLSMSLLLCTSSLCLELCDLCVDHENLSASDGCVLVV